MKTEKEIEERATKEAMRHVFCGVDEESWPCDAYNQLVMAADATPNEDPVNLTPWEAFEYRGSKNLLSIVDGLADCLEEAMIWSQK